MNVDLYTDAGVTMDQVGTWATIIVVPGEDPVERSGRLRERTNCSATAELRAIANALHFMIRKGTIKRGYRVRILTDSAHAVHRLTGVYKRRPKSTMAAAAEVVLKIAADNGITIKPVHIPGHKPDDFSPHAPFNNRCDKLCRQARKLPEVVKPTKARKALTAAKRLSGVTA